MDVVITFSDGEVITVRDCEVKLIMGGVMITESDKEWSFVPLTHNVRFIDVKEHS